MKYIPDTYENKLDIKETEKAIKMVKDAFQTEFAKKLNLLRVSAPLFVPTDTGLNDNLSGHEKAVTFTITSLNDIKCEIVHSLAKWKRMALYKYGLKHSEGLYTDMNAIRRQEQVLDNLHSVYVDQWDWEKVMLRTERNDEFLHSTVRDIYATIYHVSKIVEEHYSLLKSFLPEEIHFVKAQDLEDEYPQLTPQEREQVVAKKYGAVFIQNIGCALKSGKKHDMRAPDYDDWKLNGDIIVWYPILEKAVELSSMGIRVDESALVEQLAISGIKKYTNYHKSILNNEYPLTIGGGIGQSRLCLIMLQKAHIGEVQASIWDQETNEECQNKGITLL